jgi:hypothetical protein
MGHTLVGLGHIAGQRVGGGDDSERAARGVRTAGGALERPGLAHCAGARRRLPVRQSAERRLGLFRRRRVGRGHQRRPTQGPAAICAACRALGWTYLDRRRHPEGTQRCHAHRGDRPGPGDAWAVGNIPSQQAPYTHTLVEHFDGRAWHIVPSPDPGTETNVLSQVAACGPDDIWATGRQSPSLTPVRTLAEHWNGQRWRVVPTPDDPTADFNLVESLAVRSPADAWAAVATEGNTNGDFFTRWNGKTWQKVAGFANLHGEIALNGLAIVSPAQSWVAGGYQGILTGRWDGTSWQRVPTPAPGKAANLLEAITTVPGSNELIAVGYQQNAVPHSRTLVLVRQ